MFRNRVNISMIGKKYGILVGILLSLFLCGIVYYNIIVEDKEEVNELFIQGEEFYSHKEYDKAMDKYTEYLSDTTTLVDAKRWLAWQRLLYIVVQLKSDFAQGIVLLKKMEKEYEYDVEYMPQVLKEMVQVYHMQRSKEDVIQTLEKLMTSDFPLPQEEKIKLYRQYSVLIAEDARNFERGEQQFELCIQKEENGIVDWCKYELGVIYTLDEKYKKAKPIFTNLIAKSKPEEELHYSSRFMLATIYGFLGEKQQAIEEFKAIKDSYPNKEVIESRIRALYNQRKNDL